MDSDHRKFKDCFGKYYYFYSSRVSCDGKKNALRFSNTLTAKRFLRSLQLNHNDYLFIVSMVEGRSLAFDDADFIETISYWLTRGRVYVVHALSDKSLSKPAHLRSLKDARGKSYTFVSAVNSGNVKIKNKQTFYDVAQADGFIQELNPTLDNLDAIQEIIDVDQSLEGAIQPKKDTFTKHSATKTASANTQTTASATPRELRIAQISQSVVENKIAIVPAKMSTTRSSEIEYEEVATLAGAKTVELAPAVDPKPSINIILSAWDTASQTDKPRKNVTWKMLSPVKKNGVTGASGIISVDVPNGTSSAKLEISTPAVAQQLTLAPTSAAHTPTDYPIKIQHGDWLDDMSSVSPPTNTPTTWSFKVAELPSLESDKGLKARLENLGFATRRLESAVTAYQYIYLNQANGSGKLADIKADLMQRHDGS